MTVLSKINVEGEIWESTTTNNKCSHGVIIEGDKNSTGDCPGSLHAVYNKIIVHVRGLETLGDTSEQYESLLIPIIMTKFSSDIHLRIAQETGRKAWRITLLLTILGQKWKQEK